MLESQFVGREDKLQHLHELVLQGIKHQASTTFIEGTTGIGKRTLLEEFKERAQNDPELQEAQFILVHCDALSGSENAYDPFIEILETFAKAKIKSKKMAKKALAIIQETAPDWVNLIPVFGLPITAGVKTSAKVSDVKPTNQNDMQADMARILPHQYEKAILEIASNCTVLVLMIVDAEWMDQYSCNLLERLARSAREHNLVIFVTCSSDRMDHQHPLRKIQSNMLMDKVTERIILNGWTSEEINKYLRTRFGQILEPDLAEWLRDVFNGVPWIVIRYLDLLEQHNIITKHPDGGYKLNGQIRRVAGEWVVDTQLMDVKKIVVSIMNEMKTLTDNLEVGPSTHFATDSWTLKDTLGYQAYAHAIARFITHKQTGRPLCISIHAPWGGGKTTLMRMIQYKLDPKAVQDFTKYNQENFDGGAKMQDILDILDNMGRADIIPNINIENDQKKVRPLITIWFNAWKYESTEQVWSGLADTIIQQVSARLPPKERELFYFQLHLRRINKDAIRQRFRNRVLNKWIERTRPRIWKYVLTIGVSIAITAFGWLVNSNNSYLTSIESYIGLAGIGGLIASIAVSALQVVQEHQKAESDAKAEEAKVNIQDYLDIPNYDSTIGFIHHVEKDLQRVFDIVDDSFLPMVIFIDDLDRCSPDKVASAMEAINLFLAGEFPNCVFVLGMDPEMVAAALEKAHSEVISKLKSYSTRTPIGWKFMDKFVQLPFVIPLPEREDLDKYIEMLLAHDESKKDNTVVEQRFTGQRDVLIENREEQNDLQIQEEQEKSIDQNIERYSDQNPEIREQILRAVREFSSTNPREIKRFLNVFRFYYFLRAARISRKLPAPSLEQLTDWLILSLKWPEVTRWIQWSPAWEDGGHLTTKKERVSQLYHKLKLLEDIGENCYKDNNKNWKTEIENMTGLKSDSVNWIGDKGLENFFRHQVSLRKERLSSAAGKGFF